ncbi:5-p-4-tetraphosphate phosphorylase [Pestalotiopsis sp. NC0098]|nr:5-p-4-tetraphosphate phosphorylase [Pestalotiopsis sp. NC0098]
MASLLVRALDMFDNLLVWGRLFYEPTTGEVVKDQGFKFEFRISTALANKPILLRDAPERQGRGGPFLNPDPDFVVATIGGGHILELSMHCLYRPAFILHTRDFAPQTDDLDLSDFATIHLVMADLGRTIPQMAIYNCGVDAGSSQGHKHMQIFALPDPFPLFPAAAVSEHDIESDIPHVSYQHYVLRLPAACEAAHILKSYRRLLEAMRAKQTRSTPALAYNVILTSEWLCVIPRSHGRRGNTGANAAGMIGIVWVKDKAERESWNSLGLLKHLEFLGILNS